MPGRLALISNLIIANQYTSMKEEKGIRLQKKKKKDFTFTFERLVDS